MNKVTTFFLRLVIMVTSGVCKAPYDDEILMKVWLTTDGAIWAWRQVSLGKRVAIVRWRWKRFKWFRVAFIIGPHDGGDKPLTPLDDLTTRRRRKALVAA